jgi:hypothetical protein
MSKDTISANSTNHQFSNNELSAPEDSCDGSDPFEYKFFMWQQEVNAAITFTKKLLEINYQTSENNNVVSSFTYDCCQYLEEQYNQVFGNKINIDNINKENFRLNWDQNFLNFIQAKIWESLKSNNLISDPWPADSYNKTANAIFENIKVDIYRFAANVIELTPVYFLGFF